MTYTTLTIKQARSLHRAFVDKYADKTLPQYRSVMGHGDFYGNNGHRGFLWEVIRPYKILSESAALQLVSNLPEAVVLWDRPLRNTSRDLQKSRVVKLSGSDLAKYIKIPKTLQNELAFLPHDIYVSDIGLNFHITFTHEYIDGFGRVCITSRRDIENDGVSPAFREIFTHFGFGEREKV